MLNRLGRGLIFVAGSVVGGLALAFLIVALRPELLRRERPSAVPPAPPPVSVSTAAAPSAPAPIRVTYAGAVQRAAPAVVNVYTARLVTERIAPSLGELFGEYLPRYRQRIERSLGSGVIVDEAGHIVTNHHVIANADSVRVQLADGRVADARIVGRDPDTDLAVLKIDLLPLPVAVLGRSDELKVGDVVLAIGNPIGLSQTVTHGIVSAVSRQQLGIAPLEDFIQTDAPINFGNSGGALVDASGALVGINTAIVAKNIGVEGIGFAIPVNMVRGVLSEIIAHGRVIRGWIGIVPEDLPDEQAQQLGLSQPGVLIGNLYVGSPAQQAGLQPGDLLLAIDGVPPHTAQDALGRIANHKPGSSVRLKGLRNGRTFEVRAQVGERPRTS
ncbi:MAG: trypsin-like peptidase domain-containing protein [Gammaproteobacteria bacterium]|nr:trypsin-like peptidase domain-containing protein [Gammaproteobacteria bacterium]MBV9696059.1 trypsin-like peptidase domain-containing protein [Gammaproteobacteria bacterium]